VETRTWTKQTRLIAVDNGRNRGRNSAVYKGATLGVANGHNFLYVTDFHTGKVETYDESFHQVNPGGFNDPKSSRRLWTIRYPKCQWRNLCDLRQARITPNTMTFPGPGFGSSTCSYERQLPQAPGGPTATSMPHGVLLSWTANSGSAISVTD